MPDLMLYSASLAKDTMEQGIRGIRISELLRGNRDLPMGGSGLTRQLIEKFLEMIPDPDGRDIAKTHINTNNLILLDVLMKDFNFVAPPGTKPAGYAKGHKFYVKREYFQNIDFVIINSVLAKTKNLIPVDDLDIFKNDGEARPIYLGVSLERKQVPLTMRTKVGARLAADPQTEKAAKSIALIYKDILERGIPDTNQRISTVYNTSPIYPHIRQI